VTSPRVSVIIPAYDSDATIADCLAGLREQTFRDFEVIVVNSSCGGRTRQLVGEGFKGAIFEQASQQLLPHAARNRGVELARGELLVFTDPDCRASSDWLERLTAAQDAGHLLVCGAIELSGNSSWFERGVHLCKYSFRLSGLPACEAWIAGTANACCSREVWNAVGPFDGEHFSGDALFSWRAAARGWQPWFEPRAVVEHHYCGSLESLLRERLNRGEDFAAARVAYECWSRTRAAAHIAASPLALLIVLARGCGDAFAVRQGWTFLETLPLQLVGHAAWLVGELRPYYRRVVGRADVPALHRGALM
jgi:glycosyltransferase involved in cell wall biosynthesis